MKTLENLGNLKFETVEINPITKLPNVLEPKEDIIYMVSYLNKIKLEIHYLVYVYIDKWLLIEETIVDGSLKNIRKK